MENEKFVLLTEKQIDDLIYFSSLRATKRACDNLFGGLIPYLNRLNEDNGKILEELDFIKLSLQNNKRTTKKSKKVNPEETVNEFTDEQKEAFQKVMKEAIEMNRFVNLATGAVIKNPEKEK
jgi:hypothetical protein